MKDLLVTHTCLSDVRSAPATNGWETAKQYRFKLAATERTMAVKIGRWTRKDDKKE